MDLHRVHAFGRGGIRRHQPAAWRLLLCGLYMLTAAAMEIVILSALILVPATLFWKHDRLSGVLLVPSLLWVT